MLPNDRGYVRITTHDRGGYRVEVFAERSLITSDRPYAVHENVSKVTVGSGVTFVESDAARTSRDPALVFRPDPRDELFVQDAGEAYLPASDRIG